MSTAPKRPRSLASLTAGPALALALVAWGAPASAVTYQVGPTRSYLAPSSVAGLVIDGDVVEIDAGTYTADVATWTANRLTLRGVGGTAHLAAGGASAEGKAIWVIAGNDTVVENIEFSGATVTDRNGAGIRQEGAGLTIRHCNFHDNENGILAGDNSASDILIEYSIFARNGYGDGYSHNMYINHVRSFTMRWSWSHDARVGHDVKSRADTTILMYNRITDEEGGDASYEIQLPNGGLGVIVGNVIHQGAASQNGAVISYGDEGADNPSQSLFVVNNTMIDERGNGVFVRNLGPEPAVLINNLFVGLSPELDGLGTMLNNMSGVDPLFVDAANHDYRLALGSPAVDRGIDPGSGGGQPLAPLDEYVHPAMRRARPTMGALDLGAYEGTGLPQVDGGVSPDAGGAAGDGGGVGRDAGSAGADGGTSPGADGGTSPGADGAIGGGDDGAVSGADAGTTGVEGDAGSAGSDASGAPTGNGSDAAGTSGGCGCGAARPLARAGANEVHLSVLLLAGLFASVRARTRRRG